jgi:hypothetical protein
MISRPRVCLVWLSPKRRPQDRANHEPGGQDEHKLYTRADLLSMRCITRLNAIPSAKPKSLPTTYITEWPIDGALLPVDGGIGYQSETKQAWFLVSQGNMYGF